MNLLIWKRIKNRSKMDNVPIPSNYKNILRKYQNIQERNNQLIVFSFIYDWGSEMISANAMLPGVILVNAEYAANIVLYDNNDTMNAFLLSIGHELTHKDGDIDFFRYIGSNQKFIRWVNEIHADFGAAQKTVKSNRKLLVSACEYKQFYKLKRIMKDDDTKSHPSWSRRIDYAKYYNFDEQLIRQIAKDTNCTNEPLIQLAIHYFEPILLN